MLSRSKPVCAYEGGLAVEQLYGVCKSQLTSLPMNCALALFVSLTVKSEVDSRVLGFWLVAILVVNTTRLLVVIRDRRKLSDPDPYITVRVLRPHGFGAFASGLTWAVVPLVMFNPDNASANSIVFILCGITAGSSVLSGAYALSAIAFTCPIISSLTVKLLIAGSSGSYMLPVAAGLYMTLICYALRRSEATFVKNVLLKLKATSLAVSLDREHGIAMATAERVHRLANHDPLTGLANRTMFASHLAECIDRAEAMNSTFGLLLLDLDHFKSINDTLGHSVGDEVLKETARRLTAAVGTDHLVARLGGDEFAIFYDGTAGSDSNLDSADDAEREAEKILTAVSGIYHSGANPISIRLSIGLAIFPTNGTTTEGLLANADLALYSAKDNGRQRWCRFDTTLLARATHERDVERDLPAALLDGALQVFYQPQIDLRDGTVKGLEALLRWYHPFHGWVAPPTIVAAARRIHKSEALTAYVLNQACLRVRRLNDTGFSDVLVAFNVSPSELDLYDLSGLVLRLLAKHGIEPGRLEVEITEEALVGSEKALATMTKLASVGVRLAIDDFGTGCSALAYLRMMRVDRIKIDRSFITGLASREEDRILVQAIIGIGQSFEIEVVAEGVETYEELLLLKSFGCMQVQGYHFAPPLSEEDLLAWLAKQSDKDPRLSAVAQTASANLILPAKAAAA